MKGMINGIDFWELSAQKYYAPPNSWSEEKKHDTAYNRIFSGDWWGARKVDGAFYKFLKDEDGNMSLTGRSKSVGGDYLDKIEWVPHLHSFFESLPNGTCFIGELYLPSNEQAKSTTTIMNCLVEKAVKRQEIEPLHYYIFDVLAWDGEVWYTRPAIERFDELNAFSRAYLYKYVEWAQYYCGKELWQMLQELLAEGYEGMVITRAAAPYQPGKRPSKDCLKVKKELQDTIDCVVIGANPPSKLYTGKEIESWPYWFDEMTNTKVEVIDFTNPQKSMYKLYVDGAPVIPVTKNWFYGWAGSLKLGAYKDGKLVEIGNLSGITDEVKENWRDWVGKVIEVTAMEVMDTGGLRHPKYVGERSDKAPTECTWDSIFK
jgi:hypothetical protein